MAAGMAGVPVRENPHLPDSDLSEVWIGGWKEGVKERSRCWTRHNPFPVDPFEQASASGNLITSE